MFLNMLPKHLSSQIVILLQKAEVGHTKAKGEKLMFLEFLTQLKV